MSIPRGKRKDTWIPFWKEHNIDKLIIERDNINERLKTNNTVELRNRLSALTNKIEQEIYKCKQEKWAEFCSNLDPRKDSSHWNIIKILDNNKGILKSTSNVITDGNKPLTTNLDTANYLAEHYSRVSRLSYNVEDRKLCKQTKKLLKLARNDTSVNTFSFISRCMN